MPIVVTFILDTSTCFGGCSALPQLSHRLCMPRSGAAIPLFMSLEEILSTHCGLSRVASKNVSLSPWVNERFPAWAELLSAHQVARLTRRPHWLLIGMMVLGRFPKERRFHGRGIGWLRSEIAHWMAKHRPSTG